MVSTKVEPVNPALGQLTEERVIEWLLGGDPAIEWQTLRDLTNAKKTEIEAARKEVATKGWGKKLLDYQDKGGTWAGKLYSPKWISTTYTMRLGLSSPSQT